MGEMHDSDWSRENLLRSDWLLLNGAIMTTSVDVRKICLLTFVSQKVSEMAYHDNVKYF